MSGMVTVTALESFEHDGRRIRAKQRVTMRAIDAAVLARQQKVSLSKPAYLTAATEPEPPEPPPTPARRRRRTYRRRDLVPEE